MITYSRNLLFLIQNTWNKTAKQSYGSPTLAFSSQTWNHFKLLGILRPYRGKRGGNSAKPMPNNGIPIVKSRRICSSTRPTSSTNPRRNLLNIQIHTSTTKVVENQKSKKTTGSENLFVPAVMLSNVMSLAPKIDEIREAIQYANMDIVCLTETWLRDYIHDNIVSVPGFNLVRRDRTEGLHGGVCVYVKETIKFQVLIDLMDNNFEVIWIQIRPSRLPRGMPSIIIANVYHPPSSDDSSIINYLYETMSTIEARYPNSGVLLLGDFNKLNISRLKNSFKLKQIVKFPTRGQNTLDLILTNMFSLYDVPIKRPPFGLSDHYTIEVRPLERSRQPKTKYQTKSRDLRTSNRLLMRTYLEVVDIKAMVDCKDSCNEKTELLETIINTGLDFILPLKSKTVLVNEPLWMNSSLKNLIRRRQKALTDGDLDLFHTLRNRVNRERKVCRSKYYESKVEHLKDCKPAVWWKEIKKLSGMSTATRADLVADLQHINCDQNTEKLANVVNKAFLSPMSVFTPLAPSTGSVHSEHEPSPVPPPPAGSIHREAESPPTVTETSVLKKLYSLNPSKASGPDGIPSWLLKENADLLAAPVADIINCSYKEAILPASWKRANIAPIPKQKPITDINKHLRPISLTPILSKVAEEFVVDGFVKPAVLKKVDPNQFGTVPNSSTVHALISMTHAWCKHTDGNGSTVRVALFDFRKAFDLIDHWLLVEKLRKYDLPEWTVNWIVDFLTNRKQRVKLSQDCYSEWGDIPAGVPQGTKLGPWLFIIMINELDVVAVDLWKYVDDTTIAEVVPKTSQSSIQKSVDELVRQTNADRFQLNEPKCKELRISFAKNKNSSSLTPISINDTILEVVSHVKLLGLYIADDLKWNVHVSELVKKVSSRLYFLKQLKRACIAKTELVTFYVTCIRPVLEYACQVFHNALTQYLSDELERLQKRALRIIFPDLHYSESLQKCGLDTLDSRRQALTVSLFNDIINDVNHKLHHLLPCTNHSNSLRNNRKFHTPVCKTNRFKNSFLMYNAARCIT